MTNLNIIETTFQKYNFSVGDWIKTEFGDEIKHLKISSRTKGPLTYDGESVGEEGEPVYLANTFDADSGDVEDDLLPVKQSDAATWSGPEADEEADSDEPGLVYDDNDDPIQVGFSASPVEDAFLDGFNEYGVRRNFSDDGENLTSVDAIYEAMEPGPPEDRNGFRITEDFLRTLANKDYSNNPPYMMDHSEDTLSQIGFVQDVWFDDAKGKLMLMARAYNTGSTIHNEIVNRLTHEPPATPGGSVGLNESYKAKRNADGEVEIVDARIEEFSTTPFPGGYDEGGLRASGSVN